MTKKDAKPKPGACGATTRAGKPCGARPVAGRARCRLHGGAAGRPADPAVSRTVGWRNLDEEGQRAADALMRDPQLLDVRRMLALMESMARRHLLPSPELVAREARARALAAMPETDARRTVGAKFEPDPVDYEEAERELMLRAWSVLDRLASRMDAASKTARVDELMVGLLLPTLEELGQILARVLEKHVPNEVARREAREDVGRALRVAVARAHAVAAEARR